MGAWTGSEVRMAVSLRAQGGGFVPIEEVESGPGRRSRFEGRVDLKIDERDLLPADVWFDIDWLGPFLVQPLDECLRTGAGEGSVDGQPPLTLRVERVPRSPLLRLSVSGFHLEERSVVGHESDVMAEVARGGLALYAELERLGGARAVDYGAVATLRAWRP